MFGECGQRRAAPYGTGVRRRRAGDQADPVAALLHEVLGSEARAAIVVDAHRTGDFGRHVAIDHHARAVAFEPAQQGFVLEPGTAHHHAVHTPLLEHPQGGDLAFRVFDHVGEKHRVAVVERHVLDTPHDLGEVGVGDVGNEQPHGRRLPRFEAACQPVGSVPEVVDRPLDPSTGGGCHAVAVVDDP